MLGFLLANALWQHMGLLTACAAAVLITCMLGIADGAVSLMVPDHPFSFFDWLVGAGGALAGGIVAIPPCASSTASSRPIFNFGLDPSKRFQPNVTAATRLAHAAPPARCADAPEA